MSIETKAEKFVRLSQARSEKAIYHIDLISNLSSSTYEYSPKQVQDLIRSLRDAVDRVEGAFGVPVTVPEPEPEPVPAPQEEVPAYVAANNNGPFTRGWTLWGYEMLKRGEKAQCETMLERALRGDAY